MTTSIAIHDFAPCRPLIHPTARAQVANAKNTTSSLIELLRESGMVNASLAHRGRLGHGKRANKARERVNTTRVTTTLALATIPLFSSCNSISDQCR